MHDLNHNSSDIEKQMPEDLKRCLAFHGHLCPGLVYGYLVAKQAMNLLGIDRCEDEEVVVISENDTCAVDALQVLLGTTTGKGNLILKDYGKNVFTIYDRADKSAFRLSRKEGYRYEGEFRGEFEELETAFSAGHATAQQRKRQKLLKAIDLLAKPFDAVFQTTEVECPEPPYAALARSKACAKCGDMTMETRMIETKAGKRLCVPCLRDEGLSV